MLALVDGVPRTLNVGADGAALRRRTRSRSSSGAPASCCARRRSGRTSCAALLKALDRIDEVIALIRAQRVGGGRPRRADDAARDRRDPGHRDPRHAAAPARRPGAAAICRSSTTTLMARDRGVRSDPRQPGAAARRSSARSSARSSRSTATSGARGSSPTRATCPLEDLIAEEDVVVTITRGGYAKRTKTDLYRAQRRGGKGVQGAQLKQDDIVEHFFVTTTHHWILFFTNKGRVYRAKAHELPETGRRRARPARRQHPGLPAGRAASRRSSTSRTTRSRRTSCSRRSTAW